MVKNTPNARDTVSIPGSERCPGVENSDPFSSLAWKDFVDRAA